MSAKGCAYYNENDPKAAAWLRELIKGGHIAPGEVDERSIEDVTPKDLSGFDQAHFFAGIGGWSRALRIAGWPDDRPVWTGSCPCQPFSAAGKRKGTADERHLWPAWHWLISKCKPDSIFGEQVASLAGRAWLDIVSTDLEGEGYAIAPAVLPACSVGAPHIRQRLWWVAHPMRSGWPQRGTSTRNRSAPRSGRTFKLGDSGSQGTGRDPRTISETKREAPMRSIGDGFFSSSAARNPWNDCDWIFCTDGKQRPTQPGIFPLAHGVSGRLGLLRGYGNAIVPEVAAAFIEACGEI